MLDHPIQDEILSSLERLLVLKLLNRVVVVKLHVIDLRLRIEPINELLVRSIRILEVLLLWPRSEHSTLKEPILALLELLLGHRKLDSSCVLIELILVANKKEAVQDSFNLIHLLLDPGYDA